MSISGIGSGSSNPFQMRIDRGSQGTQGTQGTQQSRETEMKAKLEELKKTNPELAEKMEKIQSRMEELKKSGVSRDEAMQTIEKEFGKPTEAEMKAMGPPPGPRPSRFGGQSDSKPTTSSDISSLLSGKTENDSILDLLSSRS